MRKAQLVIRGLMLVGLLVAGYGWLVDKASPLRGAGLALTCVMMGVEGTIDAVRRRQLARALLAGMASSGMVWFMLGIGGLLPFVHRSVFGWVTLAFFLLTVIGSILDCYGSRAKKREEEAKWRATPQVFK